MLPVSKPKCPSSVAQKNKIVNKKKTGNQVDQKDAKSLSAFDNYIFYMICEKKNVIIGHVLKLYRFT